jgi:predicted nucleic acid-binding protein
MIVSDAGPIIIFARIGRLSLLREITNSLTIPVAVHAEKSSAACPARTKLRLRRGSGALPSLTPT